MSASQYRCASVGALGELHRAAGRSTAADSQQLLPLCSPPVCGTEVALPVSSRLESEPDGDSRAGSLLSRTGVPGTHYPAHTFSEEPCLLGLPVQSLFTFLPHSIPCVRLSLPALAFSLLGMGMRRGAVGREEGAARVEVWGNVLFCK